MDGFRYRAFISYSHADEKWAAWLHRSLENYQVPKHLAGRESATGQLPKRLTPIFRDREELPSASNLGQKLQAALEASENLILICSPASAKSHWVNEEVLAFKRMGRADKIFCVIVGGEPNHPEDECFPPAAKFDLDSAGDLSNIPAEPIAADARTGKDGRNVAKLKLIAGMLDVGFDDLQQRELHRRHRRQAIITTSALAGMFIALGLMFAAMSARNEAQQQREFARLEAEKARQTAGFMVNLFSVSDPSEARGRSITAREILVRGAENIEAELSNQPLVQAGLMETIGKVYVSLGLFEDAEPLLRKANEKRTSQSLIVNQQGPENNLELANANYLLANVLTERAQYEEAEQLYKKALSYWDGSTDNLPLNTDIQAAMAELYFRTGRYKAARPLLEAVLKQRRKSLGSEHPKVADAMAELGLNYFDQGEFEEAEKRLREALAIQRKIYGDKPHPDIGETLNNLGLILAESQRLKEADLLYAEAIDINRKLFGEFHPAVAIGVNNLGLLARRAGDNEKAERLFNEALAIHRHLHGDSHPQVALVLTNLALTYYEETRYPLARDTLGDAIVMQRQLLTEDDPQIARSEAILGRWFFEAGDYNEALALQISAIEKMQKVLEPLHPQRFSATINSAETYIALNQLDLAKQQLDATQSALDSSNSSDEEFRAWQQSVHGYWLSKMGERELAQQQLTDALDKFERNHSLQRNQIKFAKHRLADHYLRNGQTALAAKLQANNAQQLR